MARIIPVIDVMGGRVVRAVGGRRSEYRPIHSRLTNSTDPVEVTAALLKETGVDLLYVADLDLILGRAAAGDVVGRLADVFPDITIWADCGLRTRDDYKRFPTWKTWRWSWLFGDIHRTNLIPVFGSETLKYADSRLASDLDRDCGGQVVFSVDLLDGRWLGDREVWQEWGVRDHSDPLAVADAGLRATGARNLLLLDLARVGTARGSGIEHWLAATRRQFPDHTLASGGGVRDWDDVKRLEDAGADAVLVASALHDGTLTFPRPAF
jgi:phosphoribosylformimino-5-aminoimidazole carboxamide ribotide isomerase